MTADRPWRSTVDVADPVSVTGHDRDAILGAHGRLDHARQQCGRRRKHAVPRDEPRRLESDHRHQSHGGVPGRPGLRPRDGEGRRRQDRQHRLPVRATRRQRARGLWVRQGGARTPDQGDGRGTRRPQHQRQQHRTRRHRDRNGEVRPRSGDPRRLQLPDSDDPLRHTGRDCGRGRVPVLGREPLHPRTYAECRWRLPGRRPDVQARQMPPRRLEAAGCDERRPFRTRPRSR